jgi:hypothetical protein
VHTDEWPYLGQYPELSHATGGRRFVSVQGFRLIWEVCSDSAYPERWLSVHFICTVIVFP